MKKFEKFIIPGGEKFLFWNNGSERLFMFKVFGFFKDMDL